MSEGANSSNVLDSKEMQQLTADIKEIKEKVNAGKGGGSAVVVSILCAILTVVASVAIFSVSWNYTEFRSEFDDVTYDDNRVPYISRVLSALYDDEGNDNIADLQAHVARIDTVSNNVLDVREGLAAANYRISDAHGIPQSVLNLQEERGISRLQAWIVELGLNADIVASRINRRVDLAQLVTATQIEDYAQPGANIDDYMLFHIATALGIQVTDLIDWEPKKNGAHQ